jgi:hypothetical protein
MKKILIGLLQTTLSPFVVIFGYYAMATFKVPEGVMIFASTMGGLAIVFNFVIGCALIVRGYQDEKTFEGWSA